MEISLLKTLRFNFHYFSWIEALKLPVVIFKSVEFHDLRGGVFLPKPVSHGIISIGRRGVGFFSKNDKTVWDVRGNVVFNGRAGIGSGSRICVAREANLTFGKNFAISAHSTIDCVKSISFGNDCLLSWDVMVMDSDYHKLYHHDKQLCNRKEIEIGNHVWITNDVKILKGVTIPDNVVISCRSLVTKSIPYKNSVISSNGKDIILLKEDITWEK